MARVSRRMAPPINAALATGTPAKKAIASPMQYWISVPKGWPGKRTWPVVMTIAGAGRDYEANAKLFAAVRDNENYPFIIVSPVLLTNSGDGPVPRTQAGLDYPSSTWDLIDRVGRCAFDKAGVAAVIAEARNQYSGASRDFLTGFSGGGNPFSRCNSLRFLKCRIIKIKINVRVRWQKPLSNFRIQPGVLRIPV